MFIINNFIKRNFGEISFDIDFNYEFDGIKLEKEKLKNEILNEKLPAKTNQKGVKRIDIDKKKENEEHIIKVNSVFLFKNKYNKACT